jgi:hypothetical protein
MKEVKANLAELEAARKAKTKATTSVPEEENKADVQRYASCRRVRVVAATTTDGRDRAALRRELVDSDRMNGLYDRLANSAGFQEGDQVWL